MKTVNVPELIEYSRTWLDTPWQHNQRCRGVGVDCVQLVVDIYQHAGLDIKNPPNYPRSPRLTTIEGQINSLAEFIEVDKMQPSDMLLIRTGNIPHHLGIVMSENSFIHADNSTMVGRVIESPIDLWSRRIVGVYRIKKLLTDAKSFGFI